MIFPKKKLVVNKLREMAMEKSLRIVGIQRGWY